MRTFATLALAGSYAAPGPGQLVVGRLIANTGFARALLRHSGFERFCFFVGENADVALVERLFVESGLVARERLLTPNLLELPRALGAGELSVLHHNANLDLFFHLVWLRDQHARGLTVPVTTQIHSLSYPREMQALVLGLLAPPSPCDAVFCSSTAGRTAVEKMLAAAARGLGREAPRLELPVVPLGVDLDALRGGDRAGARTRLGIPAGAFVVLCLARFTEHDKMDLFPLLQAFRGLARDAVRPERPAYLLLAGSRQGTRTPETLELWARMLRVEERLRLHVDFAEEEKRDLLAAADVFVSPSDNPQETFGLSVVEAMAAGLPVVASDFDGYRDTVTDEAGLRVPTRWGVDLSGLSGLGPLLYERPLHLFLGQSVEVDLGALEAALRRLYLDDALREELARGARARAERYAWPRVIAACEERWRALAARPAAAREGAPAPHPLALDFAEVFAHYPTERGDPRRRVVASELAGLICHDQNYYPIYPELRNLVADDDVLRAVRAAARPIAVAELAAALAAADPARPAWRAGFVVAWLLKHGLLVDAG